MEEKNHIYPIFDRMMTRQDKEELLGQHMKYSMKLLW